MNNNRPPASNFQKSERETGNQVSLALVVRRYKQCHTVHETYVAIVQSTCVIKNLVNSTVIHALAMTTYFL